MSVIKLLITHKDENYNTLFIYYNADKRINNDISECQPTRGTCLYRDIANVCIPTKTICPLTVLLIIIKILQCVLIYFQVFVF